jgi:hypothetical protein
MKYTAEVRVKGKERPHLFEFHAKDDWHAAKLMNDYCASLSMTTENIDVRRHPDIPDGSPRHKW